MCTPSPCLKLLLVLGLIGLIDVKGIDVAQPTLQSHTGKYRGLQGNPCNENRIPAMRTGFPVMKTGFSLLELTYREFPVSLIGFGLQRLQKLFYISQKLN